MTTERDRVRAAGIAALARWLRASYLNPTEDAEYIIDMLNEDGIDAATVRAALGAAPPTYRDVLAPENDPSRRSGKPCVESGCDEPAGTAWGPYFCVRHNAARLDRISASLAALVIDNEPKGAAS